MRVKWQQLVLYVLCFLQKEWLAGHIRGFTTSLTAQSTSISLVTSESQERIKPVSCNTDGIFRGLTRFTHSCTQDSSSVLFSIRILSTLLIPLQKVFAITLATSRATSIEKLIFALLLYNARADTQYCSFNLLLGEILFVVELMLVKIGKPISFYQLCV